MIEFPKVLITFGIILVVIGVLWTVLGKYLPLGKLPGDIAVEKKNFSFYFPITTSIIISLVLTLVFFLLQYFRK